MVRSFFGFLGLYLAILPGLLVLGAGVGLLVRWIFPSVDRGMGLLIEVVSSGMATHFFPRLIGLIDAFDLPPIDDYDDDIDVEVEQQGRVRVYRKVTSRAAGKQRKRK